MEFNITDERAVIGCAVLEQNCARRVFAQLEDGDFTDNECADAFVQMRELWKRDGRVDVVTVGRLPAAACIVACAETVPSLSGCGVYIKHVRENAVAKRAAVLGLEIASGALSLEELQQKSAELGRMVHSDSGKKRVFAMKDMLLDFMQRHVENRPTEYLPIGMGLTRRLRMSAGKLLIVGARPSVGKTAFSLQMAMNLASRGVRTVFFSLETDQAELTDRYVSCMGGYEYGKVQDNEIDITESRMAKSLDIMARYPFFVVDAAGKTAEWIESEAIRLEAEVIVVDYLGLVRSEGKSLYEQTTNASRAFQRIAKANNLFVILLSQLNRAGNDVPKMEHLRESGQIEQDADAIVLLHDDKERGTYTAIVAKVKSGRTGAVMLQYDKDTQHFAEVDYAHHD